MDPGEHLLIVGASVRAAAFSALRAGLRPWCADLFADADLQTRFPVVAVPDGSYPEGLASIVGNGPLGPWMYTGALENRPALVREIARRRPLWGNDGDVLQQVRHPHRVAEILRAKGLPCPAVRMETRGLPDGRWLVKPRSSAGGSGIRFWKGNEDRLESQEYLQEWIEGEPCAAVYVGEDATASLLGATVQLVGESWLHARPFHYCGSVGRVSLEPGQRRAFDRIGNALAQGCGLRGLFGVDCVLRAGVPWPVEVNPRYTASVEVLEYTLGVPALALHGRVFDPDVPELPLPAEPVSAPVVGKAILFARAPLVFPAAGPWTAALHPSEDPRDMPVFADIPHAGEAIRMGRPILTFFARAGSIDACRDALQQIAGDLDRWLYGS
jgi:predicted ATP-grasp superfamily ATP-dependent carboligase